MGLTSEELLKRKNKNLSKFNKTQVEFEDGYVETERVRNILENTSTILDDLDKEFEEKTGLNETDTTFLFLAIGLQIARQYLLSNEKFRLDSNQGDKLAKTLLSGAPKDWKDILTQSVPYDAISTGNHISDTGLSGTTHRYRTLGHDPIFGWIFGTANILTNSLTKTNFETYQVHNMQIIRHYPNGIMGVMERSVNYSANDPKLLLAAIARQAIHFGSDYFTKQGLPVPAIATVNNQLAQKMICDWNIDAYSITRAATIAVFINSLISIIHGFFYNEDEYSDRKIYEVKTRKIIMYSNLIATSSNIAIVALTKNMKKFDVGGIAITIYRLITDTKFICQVKEEFIFGSYKKMIEGTL